MSADEAFHMARKQGYQLRFTAGRWVLSAGSRVVLRSVGLRGVREYLEGESERAI
jgi:hypothetical protein